MIETQGIQIKVILVGERLVGKTSIRQRYMGKGFKESYFATLGSDFSSKSITLGDLVVHLQIWDLAGHAMFKTMRPLFYKGANAVLLVYDCTNRLSFEKLDNWLTECFSAAKQTIKTVAIIANKVDLEEFRVIASSEGEEYAKYVEEKYKVPTYYVETSALTGENIEKLFYITALSYLPEDLREEILEVDEKARNYYLGEYGKHDQNSRVLKSKNNLLISKKDVIKVSKSELKEINNLISRINLLEEKMENISETINKLKEADRTILKYLEDLYEAIRRLDEEVSSNKPKLKIDPNLLSFLDESF